MRASQKYFLLHQVQNEYKRAFPPFEKNIMVKLLLGAVIEACILERRAKDLEFFQNYLNELRMRFKEKKYYGLEIIETQTFEQ